LKELKFGSNELSGYIPKQFYSLSIFENFDLNSNHLSGTISDRIKMMSSLKYLQLQNNNFGGGFPQDLTQIPLGMPYLSMIETYN